VAIKADGSLAAIDAQALPTSEISSSFANAALARPSTIVEGTVLFTACPSSLEALFGHGGGVGRASGCHAGEGGDDEGKAHR